MGFITVALLARLLPWPALLPAIALAARLMQLQHTRLAVITPLRVMLTDVSLLASGDLCPARSAAGAPAC